MILSHVVNQQFTVPLLMGYSTRRAGWAGGP